MRGSEKCCFREVTASSPFSSIFQIVAMYFDQYPRDEAGGKL